MLPAVDGYRRYLYSLGLVVAATAINMAIHRFDPSAPSFGPYYPAVLLATLAGGTRAGVAGVVLSTLSGWYIVVHPSFSLSISDWESGIKILMFLVCSAALVWVADAYLKEREARALLMREMQHRTRNTASILTAIVSQTLRDHPKAADVNGRLLALFNSNDMLTSSPTQQATVMQVLERELIPYGSNRITLRGPAVPLDSSLTRAWSLIAHELATNAVKYGALSHPNGTIEAAWSFEKGVLSLTWREQDGPNVTPPSKLGFGTRLITALLQPYSGTVTSDFLPTGVVSTITCPIPTKNVEFKEVAFVRERA